MTVVAGGLARFASLLDYPGPELLETAREMGPARLGRFLGFLESSGPPEIESAYARAFDFEPSTSLDVGYHLFGDTSRRGLFLVGLKRLYRRAGYETGPELPDHLPVVLRFLGSGADFEERAELIYDCVIPAVASIRRGLERRGHPYADLFGALGDELVGEGRR